MKLGSLFDGSGTAPLAAMLCGAEPVWASEVEPYPIAVTRTHIPSMRHIGSVTEIHGAKVEPVDVITFGSPCQDMSIAGKRAGIKHEGNGDEETTRSGLFMEAIRIIKEMREATNGVYPRFAVWENVPGAFSSNHGEDFRLVLEEFVRIKEPTAVMPAVPAHGWPYADSYCGDGWSLAYRVFDAQFWGVPQRRRRIYLVADFTGQSAGEILFKRQGLRGYFETGRTPWKSFATHAERSVGADDWERAYTLKIRSGCEGGGKGALVQEDMSATLATNNDKYLFQPVVLDDQGGQQINVREDSVSPTLRAEMHGHPPCVVYDTRGNGDGRTVPTITGDHENRVTDYTSVLCMATQQGGAEIAENLCPTITAAAGMSGNNQPVVTYAQQQIGVYKESKVGSSLMARDCKSAKDLVCAVDCRNLNETPELSGTLQAKGQGGYSLNYTNPVRIHYIVRRLTPTECARLQGFPDGWGEIDCKDDFTGEEYQFWKRVRQTYDAINGRAEKQYTPAQMLGWYNKLHTDSAEYKMWGNGMALPNMLYVMQGIMECEANAT